ncbi:hypothetical protein [Microvirga soli]|nr:hypothetical protein [Microvirga soli]
MGPVGPADDATLMAILSLGVMQAAGTETRGLTGAALIEPGLPPHVVPV